MHLADVDLQISNTGCNWIILQSVVWMLNEPLSWFSCFCCAHMCSETDRACEYEYIIVLLIHYDLWFRCTLSTRIEYHYSFWEFPRTYNSLIYHIMLNHALNKSERNALGLCVKLVMGNTWVSSSFLVPKNVAELFSEWRQPLCATCLMLLRMQTCLGVINSSILKLPLASSPMQLLSSCFQGQVWRELCSSCGQEPTHEQHQAATSYLQIQHWRLSLKRREQWGKEELGAQL